MKVGGPTLSFGANLGFAHMHCATCAEVRLHRYCKCVSCGTGQTQKKYKPLEWSSHSGKARTS
jgi:hypothetical protein